MPLHIPKVMKHPPLQKIDFDSIKATASELYLRQKSTITQKFKDSPQWRTKELFQHIVLFSILIAAGLYIEHISSKAGLGKPFGIIICCVGAYKIFKVIKAFISKKFPVFSLEELEFLLYKNMLHITSIETIKNEFDSIGLLTSIQNNHEGVPEDILWEAYAIKADALIAVNSNSSISSSMFDKERMNASNSKIHYHTTATAIKLQ